MKAICYVNIKISDQTATTTATVTPSGQESQSSNEDPPATNTIQKISYSNKVGEEFTTNTEATNKLVDDSYETCSNYTRRVHLTSRMSAKLQLVETTNKTVIVTVVGNPVFSCGHVVVYSEDTSSCMASTVTECGLQSTYLHPVVQHVSGAPFVLARLPACQFSCSCFQKCSNIYLDHTFTEPTVTSAVCKIAI